jgi:hypothetical protein
LRRSRRQVSARRKLHRAVDAQVATANSIPWSSTANYIAGAGTFHSNQMHVVERYTPTADGRIHYEAIVEDPEVLKGPWKVMDGNFNHPVGDDMIAEYECLEGYTRDLGRLSPK